MSQRSRWSALVLLTAAAVCDCSKSSPCPPGLVPQGGTCIPVPDTTPHESVVVPETGGPDLDSPDEGQAADLLVEDGHGGDDSDESPEHFPGGFVGIPCSKDGDCRNAGGSEAVCLDWPGGYCTLLDCGGSVGDCPEGAACLGITPNKPACAVTCSTGAECRPGGAYGCKAVPDAHGGLVRVCYQVKKPGGPAEGCFGHQECAGDASCLTSFAGGYCAVLGCGPERPCPEGTACVTVNGMPACLRTCEGPDDCVVPGDLPRACASLKSALVAGEKVKVCASGTLGVPIGGQCLSDMECASEKCEVVVTGHCSGAGTGCRQDEDCPTFGEVCIQSAADTRGYCTKACGMSSPCPSQSLCVGTKVGATGQAEGTCLPGCLGPGDLACRAEVGLSCVFGDPVGAPAHYACARMQKGAPGTLCKAPSDCASGMCLVAAGGGGYCVSSCDGFGWFCPFPTSCQQVGGENRCLLRCHSAQDCPTGHDCTRPLGALLDVCYPK